MRGAWAMAGILLLLLAGGLTLGALGLRASELEGEQATRRARSRALDDLERVAVELEQDESPARLAAAQRWELAPERAPLELPPGSEGAALWIREAEHRLGVGDDASALVLLERARAQEAPERVRPYLALAAGAAAWRLGDEALARTLLAEAGGAEPALATPAGGGVREQALYLLARMALGSEDPAPIERFLEECQAGARLALGPAPGSDAMLQSLAALAATAPDEARPSRLNAAVRVRLELAAQRGALGHSLLSLAPGEGRSVAASDVLWRSATELRCGSLTQLANQLAQEQRLELELLPSSTAGALGPLDRELGGTLKGARLRLRAEAAPAGTRNTLWMLLAGLGVYTVGCLLLVSAWVRSRRAARMQSEFVASVSHEIKTPIASVRAMAEALADSAAAEPEKSRAYATRIEAEMERLGRTVRNVLDAARIERLGGMPVHLGPGDPARVVEDVGEAFAPTLHRRGFAFTWHAEPAAGPLPLDAEALRGVVINLVDNAAKFSVERKEVEVRGEPRGEGGYTISVLDRGRGVPAAERSVLFQRFRRGASATRDAVPGVGLGLHVAAEVVRVHEGTLRHENRAGGGSVFIVELGSGSHA